MEPNSPLSGIKGEFQRVLDAMLDARKESDDGDSGSRATLPDLGSLGPVRGHGGSSYGEADRQTDVQAEHLRGEIRRLAAEGTAGIEAALGIDRARSRKELQRLRRTFAGRYHPDRLPPDCRDAGETIMKQANAIVDRAMRGGT